MASREELVGLAAHMEWADALVWSTVLQSHAARADDKIRTWLHHVHTVQRVFTSAWRGQPLQLTDVASFEGPPALAAWGRAGLADVRAFLATADAAALARTIEMPWAKHVATAGRPIPHPTLAETALHLSIHTAHHRGQATARLRELGAEPPLVDYIAWLWKGRPDPLWPRNVAAPDDAELKAL
jgi:uncharacterized damage-inducible protein DinB